MPKLSQGITGRLPPLGNCSEPIAPNYVYMIPT
jgi:hypothetical protein